MTSIKEEQNQNSVTEESTQTAASRLASKQYAQTISRTDLGLMQDALLV